MAYKSKPAVVVALPTSGKEDFCERNPHLGTYVKYKRFYESKTGISYSDYVVELAMEFNRIVFMDFVPDEIRKVGNSGLTTVVVIPDPDVAEQHRRWYDSMFEGAYWDTKELLEDFVRTAPDDESFPDNMLVSYQSPYDSIDKSIETLNNILFQEVSAAAMVPAERRLEMAFELAKPMCGAIMDQSSFDTADDIAEQAVRLTEKLIEGTYSVNIKY